MLGFAGDLRKEVHRRLRPHYQKAISSPIWNSYAMETPVWSGPVMWRFPGSSTRGIRRSSISPSSSGEVDCLWDYESGDIATVKHQLEQNLDIFEALLTKAEVMEAFSAVTAENL